MSAENPISPKAVAATGGAGFGSAVSALVIWMLGVTVWNEPADSEKVSAAIAAVPAPVATLIAVVVPALIAAISGWAVGDPHRVTSSELQQLKELQRRA